MFNLKKFLQGIVLLLVIIALTGCLQKKEDTEVVGKTKSSIVYDIEKQPEDLVKLDEYNSRTKDLSKALFEGLVYEKEDGSIGYGLADSCNVSENGLLYTFKLKDNLKWSDGSAITSEDFCNFFKEILDLSYNSQYRSELKLIFGVTDYINKKSDFSNVAITAPDKSTLEIRLNYSAPYFLKMLSQPIYGLRKVDSNLYAWQKQYKKLKFSGAFKIESITSTGNINLEKNNNYVFCNEVKSNKITLAQGKNGGAYSLADFETNNNVDVFFNPPVEEIARLKKENEIEFYNSSIIKSLFFNSNSNSIASNLSFRKAINAVLDKNYLESNVIGAYGDITYCFFKGSDISIQEQFTEADMDYLKTIADSNESIKIVYVDDNIDKNLCENIVNTINKSISSSKEAINFELESYSSKEIGEVLKSKDYDIYLGDYTMNYSDPMAFLELWQSNAPSNLYGFYDSYYDELLFEANITANSYEKNMAYTKCIEELKNKLPIIPIYNKKLAICSKTYVKGLQVDKYGCINIENLYIKSEP